MEVKVDLAISTNDYAALNEIFTTSSSSWNNLGQGEQRSLSAHLIKSVMKSSNFLPSAFTSPEVIAVLRTALNHLPPLVENAFDNKLRYLMFDYLVKEEGDYRAAAQVLSGMRMDDPNDNQITRGSGVGDSAVITGISPYLTTAAEKTDVFVKIAECFLEEDDAVEAESFVNKAGKYVDSIVGDKEKNLTLILRYKSTYARVLDANRKFLQAAVRYHELSQFGIGEGEEEGEEKGDGDEDGKVVVVNADDLLEFLGRATTCSILSPNGSQRQRILGLIFNDARLPELDAITGFQTHSAILTKIFKNQVIRNNADLATFEKSLSDHQKAITSDGRTIVQRAIMEHNMVAVSHLYDSIYFSELGELLDVDTDRAEKIAAKMIMDGSLVGGSIDQVEGLLKFERENGSLAMVGWDEAITSFCIQLNGVTDAIRD